MVERSPERERESVPRAEGGIVAFNESDRFFLIAIRRKLSTEHIENFYRVFILERIVFFFFRRERKKNSKFKFSFPLFWDVFPLIFRRGELKSRTSK